MASDPPPKGQPKTVQLGRYEVIARIAAGGMGAVFRARDPETGRDLALKVLMPEMAAKPAMLERFRREARHAAKLQHDNIVKTYELEESQGKYFIPMEFVDGTDLLRHIDGHAPLDPEETRQIMIQACRALKQAHAQGLVHRDIKPSNFLLIDKNGRYHVKLTDFGLAREASNGEFRVTRAGTTVGTVDYMSPEQASDSGSADIRSDLYSLGCTWYHMLTGNTPFCEGGLAERILAHLKEEPPDVRRFNPRASKALVQVLKKLLAKKPRDRYQTPADLLEVLHALDPIAKPTKSARERPGVEDDEEEVATPRRPAGKARAKGARRGDDETATDGTDSAAAPASKRKLWVAAAAAAGVVLLAVVGVVAALKWPRGPADDGKPEAKDGDTPPAVRPGDPIIKPGPDHKGGPTVKKPEWPPLYEPKTPPDLAALRDRIDAAFPRIEQTRNGPPLRIKRTGEETGAAFVTLAAALAKAPDGPVTVEIHDNGPLYWSAASVRGRDVTVAAAKGYRPLIVWDVRKTVQERKAETPAQDGARPYNFLRIERGRLRLEGVDVVLQCPEKSAESLTLLRAVDADLHVENCTFSVSGRAAGPVAVARVGATKAETRRCRFTRCVLRGNSMQALDLDAPGGEVLFEDCLAAAGEHPLFRVVSREQPANVRVVRSTFTGAQTLLELDAAQPGENSPALNWLSWDSVLSRSSDAAGGDLISLSPNSDASKIHWEAVNTLYAGWQTLLTGSEPIRQGVAATWARVMKWPEGDRSIPDTWPAAQPELAEVGPAYFRTAKTPVAFAATSNKEGPIGCPLEQLPPARDNWVRLACERFVTRPPDFLDDAAPPDIPPPEGQLFTGQTLDLASVDVGAFLQEKQRSPGLASNVVLRLKGSGRLKMTPVKLKGLHLTLYFEQPADDAKRLVLTLPSSAEGTKMPEALLEIDGGLDVINGEFELPDDATKAVTASLFKVSGGDLRLYRCRLTGPHQSPPPANYRGLILFDGSGDLAADKARQCAINASALVTDKSAILINGVGARVSLKQSAVVSGGQALHVDLGPAFKGRSNVQLVAQNSTFAARRALVLMEDALTGEPTFEPVVIQTSRCAYQYPFRDAKGVGGLVRFNGDALARGLFVWQSDADLYDKRLQFACQSTTVEPPRPFPEWQAAWAEQCGPYTLTTPANTFTLQRQFEAGKSWSLEQLLLTAPNVFPTDGKPPRYGADLIANGFVKKPKRP
jgi:serine/threonine-protein kinase